ncbi:MAG: hypothetical protein P1Q69_15650 [Candidatus Thorarchaeota archaeon]|nr:hypothetical protein [Candidatus Thorarchaeota archaeon]
MYTDIINAKCGRVYMFAGMSNKFLDSLENLYNKPITGSQFGAVHTFAIFITKQEKDRKLWYLIWKPFLGFRWIEVDYFGDAYTDVEEIIEKPIHPSTKRVILDLGVEELEVKQEHFNKWRGDELTNRLIERLSRPEVTVKFQQHMQEIAEGVKSGKYKSKGKLIKLDFQADK